MSDRSSESSRRRVSIALSLVLLVVVIVAVVLNGDDPGSEPTSSAIRESTPTAVDGEVVDPPALSAPEERKPALREPVLERGRIEVEVVDRTGRRVEPACEVKSEGPGGWARFGKTMDGVAVFERVPAGEHRVRVRLGQFVSEVWSEPVVVRPGSGETVRVSVVCPGAIVVLRAESHDAPKVELQEQGWLSAPDPEWERGRHDDEWLATVLCEPDRQWCIQPDDLSDQFVADGAWFESGPAGTVQEHRLRLIAARGATVSVIYQGEPVANARVTMRSIGSQNDVRTKTTDTSGRVEVGDHWRWVQIEATAPRVPRSLHGRKRIDLAHVEGEIELELAADERASLVGRLFSRIDQPISAYVVLHRPDGVRFTQRVHRSDPRFVFRDLDPGPGRLEVVSFQGLVKVGLELPRREELVLPVEGRLVVVQLEDVPDFVRADRIRFAPDGTPRYEGSFSIQSESRGTGRYRLSVPPIPGEIQFFESDATIVMDEWGPGETERVVHWGARECEFRVVAPGGRPVDDRLEVDAVSRREWTVLADGIVRGTGLNGEYVYLEHPDFLVEKVRVDTTRPNRVVQLRRGERLTVEVVRQDGGAVRGSGYCSEGLTTGARTLRDGEDSQEPGVLEITVPRLPTEVTFRDRNTGWIWIATVVDRFGARVVVPEITAEVDLGDASLNPNSGNLLVQTRPGLWALRYLRTGQRRCHAPAGEAIFWSRSGFLWDVGRIEPGRSNEVRAPSDYGELLITTDERNPAGNFLALPVPSRWGDRPQVLFPSSFFFSETTPVRVSPGTYDVIRECFQHGQPTARTIRRITVRSGERVTAP